MYELADTYDMFANDDDYIYSVLANISIADSSISESLLSMYLSPVLPMVSSAAVDNAIAYFHGAQILHVSCDCLENNDKCLVKKIESLSTTLLLGQTSFLTRDDFYNKTMLNILALRESIFNGEFL